MKIRQGWGKQKRNIEPGGGSHLLAVPILAELIFRCHFPHYPSTCGNAATFWCETRRLFNGLTRNGTDVFHSKQKSNTPGDRQRDLRQAKLVIWSFSVLLPSVDVVKQRGWTLLGPSERTDGKLDPGSPYLLFAQDLCTSWLFRRTRSGCAPGSCSFMSLRGGCEVGCQQSGADFSARECRWALNLMLSNTERQCAAQTPPLTRPPHMAAVWEMDICLSLWNWCW